MARLQDIELSIFVANTGASKFYWDAGEGYGHEAGQFTERTYTISRKDKKLKLRQSVAGAFNPSFKRAELRFVGLTNPPRRVTVDGKVITGVHYGKRAVVVNVPFGFKEVVVE
jgi:alpha-glucosidase